jgi:glycosyltransferase involved in cell wall biosynthesis
LSHVTVTIPAFNHERYIARAIESVLDQSHRDLDVVVVDDGSSDGTLAVARRYASAGRVRCERNPENLGLAANWNRCLELATGPLVMVMGDDDELDADYLARVSQLFDEHPQAGFAYAPVRTVDAEGLVLEPGEEREVECLSAGDVAVGALIRTGVSTVTSVFRLAAVAAVGGYDAEIADGPDIELCARLAQSHDVIDAGRIGGSFRVHGNKWGHLSYLHDDRLESYMRGNRLVYERLSADGRRALGVEDLDGFVARDGARFALDGALTTLAYRRPDVARRYVAKAWRLDPSSWRRRRFWQALALLCVPSVGGAVMRRRMQIAP